MGRRALRRADGGIMATDDGLDRWIRDLRTHLARGDLVGLQPVDLGARTQHLPGQTTIRIMLADLADLDDPDGSWRGDTDWHDERRAGLLDDFRRLRDLIG